MESLGAGITSVNTWCIHMTTSPQADYISTWAWAITILVTSLSMTSSATDWFCVSSTTQNRHWSSSTAFDWYPVLVTIQLQPPYQDGTSPFGLLGISNTGTGGRNRTFTNRVKVCCATTTQHPNKTWWIWVESNYHLTPYEGGALPLCYTSKLGWPMGIDPMLRLSQSRVLPLHHGQRKTI